MVTVKKNIERAHHCPISHDCLEKCDFGHDVGIFDPVFEESGMGWNPLMSFFERLVMRMNCRAMCAIEAHDGKQYHEFSETEESRKYKDKAQEYTYVRSLCSGTNIKMSYYSIEPKKTFSGPPCQMAQDIELSLKNYQKTEKGCRLNCDPQKVGSFLNPYLKLRLWIQKAQLFP